MLFMFCLTTFCTCVNPIKFPLNFFLTSSFAFIFKKKALIFLLKPGRIITFERKSFAPIKFQNPAGNFIKKISVVSYGDYSSRIIVKMFFKPRNSFCIKMISRFVKKKNIWLLQKKPAQRNSASFTTGKNIYNLVRRRTSESIHCKFKIIVEIPCVKGIKFFLNFSLPCT